MQLKASKNGILRWYKIKLDFEFNLANVFQKCITPLLIPPKLLYNYLFLQNFVSHHYVQHMFPKLTKHQSIYYRFMVWRCHKECSLTSHLYRILKPQPLCVVNLIS